MAAGDNIPLQGEMPVRKLLAEYFAGAERLANFVTTGPLEDSPGYFQFGPEIIAYGRCSAGRPAAAPNDRLPDLLPSARYNGGVVELLCDPDDVIDNLRKEKYIAARPRLKRLSVNRLARKTYYWVRPCMGVGTRKYLQRLFFSGWEKIHFPAWPVDFTVERLFRRMMLLSMAAQGVTRVPFVWFWPDGMQSCTIVTHDVETTAGRDFCQQLMDLNDGFGIKSAFQVVPEVRYEVPQEFVQNIWNRGFEVNIHDLNHDGLLFNDKEEFLKRAAKINEYGRAFRAKGFRAGVLYRNPEWYDALRFDYDMSIPNVAHLDPQQGGCCTVTPFFIGNMIELPVTTVQDYTLFHVLGDYSIRLWAEQISRIREYNGLVSLIIHPDYVIDKSAQAVYRELLGYLAALRSRGQTWIALPNEIATWWRLRSKMRLIQGRDGWLVEGEGKERATVAYAVLKDDALVFELEQHQTASPFAAGYSCIPEK